MDAAPLYAAKKVLDDPRRTTSQPGRMKYLLSYVARCGDLQVNTYRSGNGWLPTCPSRTLT